MISRRTDILQRIFLVLLGAVFILLIFHTAYQKQHWDTDIFWALESGRWILDNLRVPSTDPFSYTFDKSPWVDFTWGFQALSWFFYGSFGGWTGVFILQLSITAIIFAVIFMNLRLMSGNRAWLSLSLLFLVFANAEPRLFMRPHLFAYLFISLYIYLLNLYEKKGRASCIYLLFPLQALWINLHSSAILGIFITGSYALGGVLDGFNRSSLHTAGAPPAKRLIAASVLLPAASVLNPYGLKLVIFPLLHQGAGNADALRHITEWMRPALRELFFYIYPFPIDHFAFLLLALGTVFSLLLNFRLLKARDILLFAGAVYMAATHVRWIPQLGFFAAPIIAANLAGYMGLKRENDLPVKWAASAIMVFFAFFLLKDYARNSDNRGLGIKAGMYPEGTIGFMRKESVKGNIYNEYDYGGFLIYENPGVKVFIDGRTPTVYSPHFFWKSRLAILDPARWKRLSAEYDITSALIKTREPFCNKLYEDREWAAVAFDDVAVLYLKRNEGNKAIIAKRGLTDMNPCADTPRYTLPDDEKKLRRIRDEIKTVADGGMRAARPHRLLGLADTKLGGAYLNEAADELEKALSINSDAYTYYDYGVALGKLNRRAEAIAALEKAIEKDSGFKEAYMGLGLAGYDNKDFKKAVCYLEKYIDMADDKSDSLAYKTLALAYFQISEFTKAADNFRKAAFTIDEPRELGEVYYYLGSSLFELREFSEGLRYYKKAVVSEPKYLDVLKKLASDLERMGKKDGAGHIFKLIHSEGIKAD